MTVYAWQFNMIERLIASQNITEVFWTVIGSVPAKNGASANNGAPANNGASAMKSTAARKAPLFISILCRIDGLLCNCRLNTLKRKNLLDLAAPHGKQKTSHKSKLLKLSKLSKQDYLAQIQGETDASAIVVNTSENKLEDEILEQTHLHVFSVFIGKNPQVIAPLTGVFEFIAGDKTITSGIQLEKPKNRQNKILFSSTTSIEPPSLCRTIEACLHKTSVFMARTIENIKIQPDVLKQADSLQIQPEQAINKISFQPGLILLTKYISRIGKRIFDKFTLSEQWILLLGENAEDKLPNQDLSSFRKIIPPKDQFWADPFLIKHKNRHYLFLEVFPYDRGLGHLSCMEILEDGSCSDPEVILKRAYHLSYPNVFEHEGDYYMVPESGDNGTIELYKATAFPYTWEFKHNLIENIRGYDSTLLFHEGLWWLFAAVSESEACPSTEELYLFHAESPLSTHWTPHVNNPLVSDAGSARPAGKIFKQGNKMIRPSQNCAGSYGAGINFCEIVTLNKSTYKEKVIDTFTPEWDKHLTGVHTFNYNPEYTVSDAIFKRGKWS